MPRCAPGLAVWLVGLPEKNPSCPRRKPAAQDEGDGCRGGERRAERTVSLPEMKSMAAQNLEVYVTVEDEGLSNPKTKMKKP